MFSLRCRCKEDTRAKAYIYAHHRTSHDKHSMAKQKSSLFSSVSSLFTTSAAPTPVPAASAARQYNKGETGESFDGERALVAEVFSDKRIEKMHRLARDHQSALSASDIIELRKLGVTMNKTLVADYSKYVSLKEQAGQPSETFLNWLNIKTGPSMIEAPTMFVIQRTVPGGSVDKIAMREFGPSGAHHAMVSDKAEEARRQVVLKGPLKTREVTEPDFKKIQKIAEKSKPEHKESKGEDGKEEGKEKKGKDKETKQDPVHSTPPAEPSEDTMDLSSMETQARLVNEAADALLEKQAELERHQLEMDAIKKHLNATGTRPPKGGAGRVADHVHSLCKQLMEEREKNEALMSQSVVGGNDASSSPLFQKSLDTISRLSQENKKLMSDNAVYDQDVKDMQASLDHYQATVKTLMGQNMDLKKVASREQYEKESHRSRAADLGQKLASTLHYHFTDEDGDGNATIFIKAARDACDCDEFDKAAERNEVEGALLLGSTQMILGDMRVGERASMEIHNASGLTHASNGEVAETVEVERISNRSDGAARGRIQETLMLGKHSVQSEIFATGENGDYYALTLNAR